MKLSPGFASNTVAARYFIVRMVYSKKRLKLVSTYQTDKTDVLLAARNDSLAKFFDLIETHMSVMLDTQTWTITEVPRVLLVQHLVTVIGNH